MKQPGTAIGYFLALALALNVPRVSAEIITVQTNNLCTFSIYEVPISNAYISGDRADVILFLSVYSEIYIHSCPFILSPAYVPNASEAQHNTAEAKYFLDNFARSNVTSGHAVTSQAHAVSVWIPSQDEFARLAVKAMASVPSPGSSHGGGTGGGPPPTGNGGGVPNFKGGQSCKKGGEICIDSEGTVSLTLSCGNLRVTLSTDGGTSIGLKGKKGDFSVDIPHT
jgi:hypothetical protein